MKPYEIEAVPDESPYRRIGTNERVALTCCSLAAYTRTEKS